RTSRLVRTVSHSAPRRHGADPRDTGRKNGVPADRPCIPVWRRVCSHQGTVRVSTWQAAMSHVQMNVHPLNHLFNPDSVAIIGASSDPSKLGGRPIRFLLEAGYEGAIYPINKRA